MDIQIAIWVTFGVVWFKPNYDVRMCFDSIPPCFRAVVLWHSGKVSGVVFA